MLPIPLSPSSKTSPAARPAGGTLAPPAGGTLAPPLSGTDARTDAWPRTHPDFPRAPAPGNLTLLLWEAAERSPDAVAFMDGDAVTRYGELRDRAAAFAASFSGRRIRPGDRVAIFMERGADAAAAWFGAVAAGAAGVLVNELLRPRQVEYVVAHCGAALLVAPAGLLARQPRALRVAVPVLDPAEVPRAAGAVPVDRTAADVAMIAYTSGSTGQPKGVAHSQGSLGACARVVPAYLGLRPDDRTVSLLPFSSVYGFNQLLCAVATGSAVVVEKSPLASRIAQTCRERGVSVLAAVPPLWHQLLRAPEFAAHAIPSLRVLQNAGGHLPAEAVRRVRAAHPHAALFLNYGMTEVMRSTFLPPHEADRRPGSLGRAIPEAAVGVVRPDGTPCETGETGELVHRGPTVALGYWRDPAATARVFRPAPGHPGERRVHSGDLVRRDAEGLLWFVGRRDGMIKSLGYRVGPDEVVDVLFGSGQVEEAVVTARPDPLRGEAIVAHVVLCPGGSRSLLEAYCRTELPRWMQPARYEVRDALPRGAAGKYDVAGLQRA